LKLKHKILLFFLFLLVALLAVIHFKARRILIELVESGSGGNVEVEIGTMLILPHKSSIRLRDVQVLVKDKETTNYTRSTVRKIFLDVASLWDFYFGGTLVIQKLEAEGGELTIHNHTHNKQDTANHRAFTLREVLQRIKSDAIRFQIKEMTFKDFSLTLSFKENSEPTVIKNLHLLAYDLNLSADSLRNIRPLIEFGFPRQSIRFPNGLSAGFDSLFFSTTSNSIQVDNIEVTFPPDGSSNTYQIKSSKARIAHFDFESLYLKGVAIVDTVFLGQSSINLVWNIEGENRALNKAAALPLMPEIRVKNLIIDQLSSDITLLKDSIENRFMIDDAFVKIQDFIHKPDSSQKITASDFDITVAKYSTFLNNSNTSVSFDTVRLQRQQLSLLNFKLNSAKQQQPVLQTAAFNLRELDWYTLLIYKRLVAHEAIVLNPIVRVTIKPANQSDKKASMDILESLLGFLEVELFSLTNATAYLKFIEQNADVILEGTNATIRIKEIIESKSLNEGLESIENISVQSLSLKSEKLNGQMNDFILYKDSPFIGKISFQAGDRINFSANGFKAEKIDWNASLSNLMLNGLGWKSATINIKETGPSQNLKEPVGKMPSLRLNKVNGTNTEIGFSKPGTDFRTLLYEIDFESLQLGDTMYMEGAEIKGRKINFEMGSTHASVASFIVTDKDGILENINLRQAGTDSLASHIEKITYRADANVLLQNKIIISAAELLNMKTYFSGKDSVESLKLYVESKLVVNDIMYEKNKLMMGLLTMEAGPVNIHHEKKIEWKEEEEVIAPKAFKRSIKAAIDTIQMGATQTNAPWLTGRHGQHVNEGGDSIKTIQFKGLQSGENGIKISVSQLEVQNMDSSAQVRANVNAITLNQLLLRSNELSMLISSGLINDLVFNSGHLKEPWKILQDNYPTAAIHNMKAKIETGGNSIRFDRLDYDPTLAQGKVKGIELRPVKDRQEFLDESFYQTNFMHTRIDSVSFKRFDARRLAEDSIIHLSYIHVMSPRLDIDRDKTHPFYVGKIRYLPSNAIQKLGVKLKIDTLQFEGGEVRYREKSRITGNEGLIYFTDLQGMVRNIKNIELRNNDTLYTRASSRFMDSANVVLRVRESYHDTLGGFLMTTQVSPFHTSILNPVLVPLAAVEFQSGYVDTLIMRAIGREYLSLGTMKFFYHDLRVTFLDKVDTSRRSAKNAILKFFANEFVIRTNNTKRIGTVFYERDRNRSVIQYWVKMILSGATTSTGVKSSKRQLRKYYKELNIKKLPSILEKDIDL